MKSKAANKSWETTAYGIAGALAIAFGAFQVLIDGDPMTMPDWNEVIAGIMIALGFWRARDANKSSEDSGVHTTQ